MRTINVNEARSTLSRLLDEVESGARFAIVRNRRTVAELRPIEKPTTAQAVAVFRSENRIKIADIWFRDLVGEARR
jgi:antitoxin (DNA-binding transcriptional repressor) of toxin-antitoxin stability system